MVSSAACGRGAESEWKRSHSWGENGHSERIDVTGPLPLLVAIDGGNSKTDVVVLDARGRELLRTTAAGSGGGPDAVRRVIAGVLDAHRLDPAYVTHVAAAVAGLDFPDDTDAFRLALARLTPFAEISVVNDAVAVMDAGGGLADALAVVCGAGLNAVARGDRGLATVPALGWASGDGGGGDQVGREAVRAGYRSFDGRGPRSVLEPRILAATGSTGYPELARAIRDGVVTIAQVGALATVVAEAAADGDAPARAILRRAAREAVLLAREVASRAWSGRPPRGTPAVLAGGLFRDPGFRALVADALERDGFAPAPLAFPPVDGMLQVVTAAAGAPAPTAPRPREDPA
jgi:N-acetylglucosamine kinase-like BadF-type ATPase